MKGRTLTFLAIYLDIPAHIKIESMIAIGYPGEEKSPHPKEELEYDKIHDNHYTITKSTDF